MRRTRTLLGGLLAAALLTATACSGNGDPASDSTGGDNPSGARTLLVFAAASLDEPFSTLAEEFERQHEGVDVQLNLAGSSDLVTQVSEGAPAHVLATANEHTMQSAFDFVIAPTAFATNTLTIAVRPGNPENITGLADLARDDVITVVCAPQVPCGAATEKVVDASGVTLRPASEETSVTGVLTKVASGEADAGLVYRTDIGRAEVEAVDFPESDAAVNSYWIAPVKGSDEADLGAAFRDLVQGPEGQQMLAEDGFGEPPT